MISMMDFFMPCCKKLLSMLLRSLLLVWLFAATAYADGISINKAEIRSSEEGYYLSASYNINLPFVVQEALSRGISLYFISEFSLTRSRWYWFDEEAYRGEQTIKLSYNVLTRQYRISRGALYRNFASIEEALSVLSIQSSTAIPAALVKKERSYLSTLAKEDGGYTAAARLHLDTTQLPKLLQVNALTGSDWTLNSDWHRWATRPTDLATDSKDKAE
jgi:hypothetical protein